MSKEPCLILEDVVFGYGQTPVLDGLSFQVQPGRVFGLLGPNGAGKSTIQKLIRGSLRPQRGQVRVFGVDPGRGDANWRSRLAWVSDQPAHHARLTVGENLAFSAGLYGVERSRCARALADVGLTGLEKRYPAALSRGQQQRLGWARALLVGAELLLLDEPTNGLDLASKEAIHQLVRAYRESGKTVLLSTHDMHEAEALCDQVGLLAAGTLRDQGSPEELCRRHLHQEPQKIEERPSLERVYRLISGRSLISPGEP